MPETPDLSRRALFRRPARLLNTIPERPEQALQPPPPEATALPPRQVAIIGDTCLAENGAYCRTCGEACPEAAIRFHLLPQGRARADVDADRCTGCGDCLFPCPVTAIRLDPAPSGRLPAGDPRP